MYADTVMVKTKERPVHGVFVFEYDEVSAVAPVLINDAGTGNVGALVV